MQFYFEPTQGLLLASPGIPQLLTNCLASDIEGMVGRVTSSGFQRTNVALGHGFAVNCFIYKKPTATQAIVRFRGASIQSSGLTIGSSYFAVDSGLFGPSAHPSVTQIIGYAIGTDRLLFQPEEAIFL